MPRWTEAARQKQQQTCLRTKPWLSATGPKTEFGKLASSQNARQPRVFKGVEAPLRRRLTRIYKQNLEPQQLQDTITAACLGYLDEADTASERQRRIAHIVTSFMR